MIMTDSSIHYLAMRSLTKTFLFLTVCRSMPLLPPPEVQYPKSFSYSELAEAALAREDSSGFLSTWKS